MIDASFYDRAYFQDGTKSNYKPYGPGTWADWLTDMLVQYEGPIESALDVGCAYGFVVERLWHRRGVPAWGFDISEYAITEQGLKDRTWVGDAADPKAWRRVDLAICTEVAEHLTAEQGRRMLQNGFLFADRMVLLIAVDMGDHDGASEGDASHINIVPIDWWADLARQIGWVVSDPSPYNDDWRSRQMSWSGRFLRLQKEA